VLEDVSGDEGFIDARVFVRFEVLECVFRYTLMLGGFCRQHLISKQWQCVEDIGCRVIVPLLGAMVVDWVTGGGSDMDARGGLA
jgi:hypothetical protein